MFGNLVSNLDIVVLLKQSGSFKNSEALFDSLKSEIPVDLSEDHTKELKNFCRYFCFNLNKKWNSAHRKEEIFRSQQEKWLQSNIAWPNFLLSIMETNLYGESSTSSINVVSPGKTSVGVSTAVSPRKDFISLGQKQKRRRTELLQTTMSSEEAAFVHAFKLRADGHQDIADILEYLLKHPEDAPRVKEFIKKKTNEPLYSPDEGLGLVSKIKLSKWQYNTLRKTADDKQVSIFPSYYQVQMVKQDCFTPPQNAHVSKYSAKIDLQALLDLTVRRLLRALAIDENIKNMTLISKWGFDGASSQAIYKQKRGEEDKETEETDICEGSVFMGSLVPIELVSDSNIIWKNDSPNSAESCRPLFFKFIKETKFSILHEKNAIVTEINNLIDTEVDEIKVSHSLLMTMLDGKATSILSETSMQRCDICKATPKEMNNLPLILSKPVDTSCYQYGISSLHLWIRFLECILHISYRLDFKRWSVQTDEHDLLKKTKMKYITDTFRERTGLLIDVVKEGHGTTNDGNTARRFFADTSMAASITGVDERLIHRFSIILQAVSSGENINLTTFKEYTRATMELFVQLYDWFYMPASVHKVLAHGAEVIGHFGLIPIGMLSEEAAEARNKDFRRLRLNNTRKFCRKASNQDLLNNLLITSDPYLNIMMKKHKYIRKHKEISEEAKKLLILSTDCEDDHEEIEFLDMDSFTTTKDLPLLLDDN